MIKYIMQVVTEKEFITDEPKLLAHFGIFGLSEFEFKEHNE